MMTGTKKNRFLAVTIAVGLAGLGAPASAQDIKTKTGTISSVWYRSNVATGNWAQTLVIFLDAVAADLTCAGATGFVLPQADGENAHVASGLLAAYLSGRKVTLEVDRDILQTGGRCTISSVRY